MIKRIPYSDSLISVNNASHANGAPVWSDGRIAYGWNYTGKLNVPNGELLSGFWVGEEEADTAFYPNLKYRYQLASTGFRLGKSTITANGHGQAQCFPCYATIFDFQLPEDGIVYYLDSQNQYQQYSFNGALIYLTADGKAVSYDDFCLYFYDADGSYTRISLASWAFGSLIILKDLFRQNIFYLERNFHSAVAKPFQLVNADEVWSEVLIPRTDSHGAYMYEGYYNDGSDSGFGLISVYGNETFVYDSSGNLITQGTNITVNYKVNFVAYNGNDEPVYAGSGYKDNTDDIIYNDSMVVIAQDYGGTITAPGYSGTGRLVISSPVPARESKIYRVTKTGIVERQSIPQTWSIGQNAVLSLPDMGLTLGDNSYSGDPLGILQAQDLSFPAGVHAWNNFVISQESKKIFKFDNNGAVSATFNGIEHCFSLEFLSKRWET